MKKIKHISTVLIPTSMYCISILIQTEIESIDVGKLEKSVNDLIRCTTLVIEQNEVRIENLL